MVVPDSFVKDRKFQTETPPLIAKMAA